MAPDRTRARLVVVLLAVSWLAAAPPVPPAAHADAILCPSIELTYGVSSSLPDPWFSTNQVGTQPTKRAVLVKGKEMIVCDYGDPWTGLVEAFVRRPRLQGVGTLTFAKAGETKQIATEIRVGASPGGPGLATPGATRAG
jgi:hypothetical protein